MIEHLDLSAPSQEIRQSPLTVSAVVDKLDKNRINVRVFLPEKEPDKPDANDSDVSTES